MPNNSHESPQTSETSRPPALSRTSLWPRAAVLSENTWFHNQLLAGCPSSQRRWYSYYFSTIFLFKTSLTFNWNEFVTALDKCRSDVQRRLMEMSRRTLCIMGSEINGDIVSSTIATKNHLQRLWMFVLTPDDTAYNHDFSCLTVFRLFESFFTFFLNISARKRSNSFVLHTV